MAGVESIRGMIGFVRTVAAGSFAGAAKELGVSPVAVSKNVQRLERRFGVRLLQRSTRKLSLTQEGRLFYERCTGPLRELESAQAAVKDKGRSAAGRLRVTSISPFGVTYVLPLLPEFSRRYPQVEVELHLDDAVSDMIADAYDVGIRAGEMTDGTMIVREIAPLHFIICGAPSYLGKHGIPRKPADLVRHNCLRLQGRTTLARSGNWLLGPNRASLPVSGNFLTNGIPRSLRPPCTDTGWCLRRFRWSSHSFDRPRWYHCCPTGFRSLRICSFGTRTASTCRCASEAS